MEAEKAVLAMNEVCIASAMQALADIDDDVARAFRRLGPPLPRHRPAGFETFLRTIIGQQISTKVAEVIMSRVVDLLPALTPAGILSVTDERLREAGLSYRKISYAKGLAEAVQTGQFNIDDLEGLSDADAIEEIIKLHGFGRWSAEIYLMFSLQRQDVFPADDLALRVALGRLKGLSDKPTPKQARELVEHWAPWRSVGSLFLWHFYHEEPG